MKKILIIGILFLLTGCHSSKNQTLNCTLKDEISGNEVIQNIVVSFSKDGVSKIDVNHKMTLNEEYIEYIDTYKNHIEDQFSKFKNQKGITTNLTETDSTITLTIGIDVANMDEESKSVIGTDVSGSYEKTKENFENEGYMCK